MNHNFIHIYHQIIEPWKLLTIISDACESSQVTRVKFREQKFVLTFTEVQHLTEGINKLKLGVTTELRDCEKEVLRRNSGVGEIHSSQSHRPSPTCFSLGKCRFFFLNQSESMLLMQKVFFFLRKKTNEWIILKIILNHECSKFWLGDWLGIIADCSRQMFLSRCNKELNESSKQWFDGIFLVCLHWVWINPCANLYLELVAADHGQEIGQLAQWQALSGRRFVGAELGAFLKGMVRLVPFRSAWVPFLLFFWRGWLWPKWIYVYNSQ